MQDAHTTAQTGKAEVPALGPAITPPEAISGPGPETSKSAPGPRKRYHTTAKGAKEVRCMNCGWFLAEVKGSIEWSRFLCNKCGANNSFTFTS